MKIVQEVGRKLLRLRKSKPVTQREVAAQAGISVSFLSMIERGARAPHLETLGKLATALHVPLAELFSFDSAPEQVEALYHPLIHYCRQHALSRPDVDRFLAMAKILFNR